MAIGSILNGFLVEEIPNVDFLYFRIHKQYLRKNPIKVPKSCIKYYQGNSFSNLWDKYCKTPEKARNYASNLEDNAIGKYNVGEVRNVQNLNQNGDTETTECWGIKVKHHPVRNNQSHTDVTWNQKPQLKSTLNEIRIALASIATIVLPLKE